MEEKSLKVKFEHLHFHDNLIIFSIWSFHVIQSKAPEQLSMDFCGACSNRPFSTATVNVQMKTSMVFHFKI